MSKLVGVMLVGATFTVYSKAADTEAKRSACVVLDACDDGSSEWWLCVGPNGDELVKVYVAHIAEFTDAEHPSPAAIDTAIAQAYDAFCLQYDIWRRHSHIEWLPVLPMSLGVEPGQRSGTWTFSAAPAPKATSPEGQQPDQGRKQKQHGKNRNNRPAGEGSARKRSKRG